MALSNLQHFLYQSGRFFLYAIHWNSNKLLQTFLSAQVSEMIAANPNWWLLQGCSKNVASFHSSCIPLPSGCQLPYRFRLPSAAHFQTSNGSPMLAGRQDKILIFTHKTIFLDSPFAQHWKLFQLVCKEGNITGLLHLQSSLICFESPLIYTRTSALRSDSDLLSMIPMKVQTEKRTDRRRKD